ncbi:unnamed protein product [Ilex paraguariensis]|uniref:Uncharacterized protein n=1 Tax=Ilex paraguariensis TaxID=185542 RepID=A0ABC8SYJ4_9AQUA
MVELKLKRSLEKMTRGPTRESPSGDLVEEGKIRTMRSHGQRLGEAPDGAKREDLGAVRSQAGRTSGNASGCPSASGNNVGVANAIGDAVEDLDALGDGASVVGSTDGTRGRTGEDGDAWREVMGLCGELICETHGTLGDAHGALGDTHGAFGDASKAGGMRGYSYGDLGGTDNNLGYVLGGSAQGAGTQFDKDMTKVATQGSQRGRGISTGDSSKVQPAVHKMNFDYASHHETFNKTTVFEGLVRRNSWKTDRQRCQFDSLII